MPAIDTSGCPAATTPWVPETTGRVVAQSAVWCSISWTRAVGSRHGPGPSCGQVSQQRTTTVPSFVPLSTKAWASAVRSSGKVAATVCRPCALGEPQPDVALRLLAHGEQQGIQNEGHHRGVLPHQLVDGHGRVAAALRRIDRDHAVHGQDGHGGRQVAAEVDLHDALDAAARGEVEDARPAMSSARQLTIMSAPAAFACAAFSGPLTVAMTRASPHFASWTA